MQVNILKEEQTRLLFEGLPKAVIVNALVAIVFVAAQISVVDCNLCFAWLVLMGAVLLARSLLWFAWFHNKQQGSASPWLNYFRIGVAATGIAWGIGAILMFPADNLPQQLFLAFFMAGLCAGVITSLSIDMVSTLSFLIPVLCPLIIRFAVEGGELPYIVSTLDGVFLFFVVANSAHVEKLLWAITQQRVNVEVREQVLIQNDERLNEAQRIAHLGSFDWDIVSGELQWSDEHFRLWGLEPQSTTPTIALFWQGIHPEDRVATEETLERALHGGYDYECVHRVVWPDGTERHIYGRGQTFWDEQGQAVRMLGTVMDVTEQKQAENIIQKLAFYDPLTELPNRRLFHERMQTILKSAAEHQCFGAILLFNLDNFKVVNESMGHYVGDLLLMEMAHRLQDNAGDKDTIARLGADEFVVILENLDSDRERAAVKVELFVEKLRSAIHQPMRLKGIEYLASPSIGICLFLGDEIMTEELLRRADMALDQAKEGQRKIRFFDPAMQQTLEARVSLEADLHRAIQDQQLQLYYQIQVDNDQRPIGAEALIRWIHPERGMVPPAQFIPLAEESSLILEIGNWVVEQACQQIAVWGQNERTHHLVLAINISAQQFKQHDFVEQVESLCLKYGIERSRLKLELTESVVLDDLDSVVQKMMTLREVHGTTLSLDDFGTGYSSLSYLKKLPLDQIKIDQSFVRDLTTDVSDAVMVRTIIDLAQNFGFEVIAEGVETEDQLAFLKDNGCMAYQGYLFSKPVNLHQFEALLKQF